jgi:hypothetical protein
MNIIADQNLHIQLARMYSTDDAAKRMFSWFSSRKKDSWEMPVRVAVNQTGLSDREVRRIFRDLADLECGRLIKGRGEHGETRMAWTLSIRSIADAAMGNAQSVAIVAASPEDNLEADLEAEKARTFPEEEGVVEHRFNLRADFEVVLHLPEDLTTHEADRLGRFLQALPL